jgi:hypothetical protein
MDSVYSQVMLAAVIVTLIMTLLTFLGFRQERVITIRWTLVSLLLTLVMLPIFVILGGVRLSGTVGTPLALTGLALGAIWGRTSVFRGVGGRVAWKPSLLAAVCWCGSYALNQAAGLLNSALISSFAATVLYLTTFNQAGTYLVLLIRLLSTRRQKPIAFTQPARQ